MHGRRLKCIGVIFLVLLVCSCAEDEELRQQVAELRAQVGDMQTTLADVNLRMEEMNSSIFVLRETARNNRETIREMQQQMQQPTVYIEQSPANQLPIQSVPADTRANQAGAEQNSGMITGDPAPLPTGTGRPPQDAATAFEGAMQQLQQSNWGLAIYDLNSFVSQYPNSEYLPRARYALGQAYRNLAEYSQAVREYERCLAAGALAGPFGSRSLYWISVCYQELGQVEKAEQARERLLREFPESAEAKKINMESSR